MPNYTDEEFAGRLKTLSTNSAASTVNAPPQIEATGVVSADVAMDQFKARLAQLPASQSAVNQLRGVEAVPNLTTTQREGRRDPNTGELIPISGEGLEITRGDIGAAFGNLQVPPTINRDMSQRESYWRIARQRGPEAQMAVLEKMYPDSKPRQLEDGSVTATIIDSATGKPKEVIVSGVGIDAHDLIDLAAQMPEIAAGTALAVAFSGTGFLKTAAQMVLSSFGAAGVGAVRDFAARESEGIDPKLGEIAASRTGEAVLDLFIDSSMLATAKAGRMVSPWAQDAKPGTLVFDAQKALQFFKREFGEDVQMLPSEVTGSPMLGAIEAIEGSQPGAMTVMQKMREKREGQVRQILDRAIGNVPSEEAIGAKSLEALRTGVVLPIEQAMETARAAAISKSNTRLTKALDEISMPSTSGRVSSSQAGALTQQAFDARLAQAQTKVDEAYAVVRDLPGGTGDVLDGTAVADAAAEIRKELPRVLKEQKIEVNLLDEMGNDRAFNIQKNDEILLKSGIPKGLLSSLRDMEAMRGGKVSLSTLTNMKRSAHDAIAAFRTAHGDVKDRWFSKVAGAYEDGIQKGIDEVGDPALKDALTKAKDTYKKELLPFERPGLKELAKDEFDPGRLTPEEIATRLFEGPKAIENLKMLQETLGENNPAFRVLRRSWLDNQLFDSSVLDRVTGEINPEALANKLQAFDKRPELERAVFGNRLPTILQELRYQKGFKNLDSLDESEVRTLLNLPNPSASDLRSLIAIQGRRDAAYANEFVKDAADGVLNGKPINPTEFVKRMTRANVKSEQIEVVLKAVDPQTRSAIATAKMYQLITEAEVTSAELGAKALRGGALNISPVKLRDAMGKMGTDERKRIEALLGTEALPIIPGKLGPTRGEVLENVVALLSPQEVKSKTMANAGGIARSQNVLNLLKNPFQYATSYAQKLAASTIWTDKAFTKFISNKVYTPAESAALANILIASEPFTRRLTEVLGDQVSGIGIEKAGTIINELKSSIDRWVNEQSDSPAARDAAELGKVARGEPANVRIQPMR